VRLPNQNPNELAGSEVRPQPPHCDKNSYILESPPFQCCTNHKIQVDDRQLLIYRSKSKSTTINLLCVIDAEKVSEFAIVVAVVDHEVGDLTCFE
jgi:hypothetical protein